MNIKYTFKYTLYSSVVRTSAMLHIASNSLSGIIDIVCYKKHANSHIHHFRYFYHRSEIPRKQSVFTWGFCHLVIRNPPVFTVNLA